MDRNILKALLTRLQNIFEAFVYTYFFFKLITSCISGLQDYLEVCAHLHCVCLKPEITFNLEACGYSSS